MNSERTIHGDKAEALHHALCKQEAIEGIASRGDGICLRDRMTMVYREEVQTRGSEMVWQFFQRKARVELA